MEIISPSLFMLGLDLTMMIYTMWVFSLSRDSKKVISILTILMILWVVFLFNGLSSKSLFSEDISGTSFLAIIVAFVGIYGAVLFSLKSVRTLLLNLSQNQLLLAQGIRVLFGGTFLMQASTGVLPLEFGILDGWLHIGAGFFGLIAAYSLVAQTNGIRRAWFANLFGLADILIVASSLSLILLPEIGPHHPIMFAVFFAAPFWIWFHAISIWKLLIQKGN